MNDMHREASTGPWLLEPARRRYAWGSVDLLPQLLGQPADGQPLAELWYGAHPAGPATLPALGGSTLVSLVREQSQAALGAEADNWDGGLPFMLKLIAAAKPLSIQVHPDAARAAAGFATDNEAGLASDDPARRYQDGRAKPEIVCALGDFDALIDFRPTAEVIAELDAAGLHDLAAALRSGGYEAAIRAALSAGGDAVKRAIDALAAAGNDLVSMLDESYPGDPGVIVATFLNRVVLRAGEAAYLAPGSVHAYLSGLAIEVMATSDNVLRAGLTSKLVDVDEFLEVARLQPAEPDLLLPDDAGRYPARAPEFDLLRHTAGDRRFVAGPALVLCTHGSLNVDELTIGAGEAAFVGTTPSTSSVSGAGEGVIATIGRSLREAEAEAVATDTSREPR